MDSVHDIKFILSDLLNKSTFFGHQMTWKIRKIMSDNKKYFLGDLLVEADVTTESRWNRSSIVQYTREARFTTLKRNYKTTYSMIRLSIMSNLSLATKTTQN